MKLLALDPSLSTGYAVIEDGEVVETGLMLFESAAKGGSVGKVLADVRDVTRALAIRVAPEIIAGEDYFFSRATRSGSNLNPKIRGVMELVAYDLGIPYLTVPIFGWKKLVCGHVRPTAQERQAYGKNANKEIIRHALADRYGLEFTPKSDVLGANGAPSGKQVAFRFDESDAVGIGLYAWEHRVDCS